MTQQQAVNKDLVRYAGRFLKQGGDKSPLLEFIGTITSWDVENSPFTNDNGKTDSLVVWQFDRIQIIRLRDDSGPYPHDTAEIKIKYSEAMRSGFGLFQSSVNEALGLPSNESDLDKMIGQTFHLESYRYNWGKIPGSTSVDNNGDTFGDVWKVISMNDNGAGPVVAATVAPIAPPVQAPLPATAPVVQPAPAPQVAAPVASTLAVISDTEVLALLNGKDKASFVKEVVASEPIRTSTLFVDLMNDAWLARQIANGVVTKDEGTGIYSVA